MNIQVSERTNGVQPSKIREVMNKVQELKKQGIQVVDFSIGRPDFDTPVHIKEATKQALDQGKVHYTATPGSLAFRQAVCQRLHEDFQIEAEPDEVIETMGATEAIVAALQGIINPGDEVLVPDLSFVYYTGWTFLAGAKPVFIPLSFEKGFIPQAEEIEKYITDKTKCIILNSPHNPTGAVVDKESITKIAELAIKYDLIVISDDIYNGVVYDDFEYCPIATLPGMKERTIIIGSFSKTYAMDGWRVGYIVAPKTLVAGITKMHQHWVSCPNTFVEIGATVALTGPQKCVQDMVKEFERRRNLIITYMDKMDLPYVKPYGAFYVFPSIKKFGMTSSEMAMYLLEEARVAVVPGNSFGDAGEGYIRIAFSTSYEEIEKGMERMKEALEKLTKR